MNRNVLPTDPRLPSAPEYWERLAQRIEEGAAPLLAARPGPTRIWWGTRRLSPALAAGAILSVVSAWLWLPDPAPGVGPDPLNGPAALIGLAVRPTDPLAQRLLESTPPRIESLLGPGEAGRVNSR